MTSLLSMTRFCNCSITADAELDAGLDSELDAELDAERGAASIAKLSMVKFSAAGAQRTGPEFNTTGVQFHRRGSVKQARRHLASPCCDVRNN